MDPAFDPFNPPAQYLEMPRRADAAAIWRAREALSFVRDLLYGPEI